MPDSVGSTTPLASLRRGGAAPALRRPARARVYAWSGEALLLRPLDLVPREAGGGLAPVRAIGYLNRAASSGNSARSASSAAVSASPGLPSFEDLMSPAELPRVSVQAFVVFVPSPSCLVSQRTKP